MGHEDRIALLQGHLSKQGILAALLFYSRDVLYYTGTAQPSYLVVSPDEYFLFVRSGLDFALKDVFIPKDRIREERRLEDIARRLQGFLGGGRRIGTELDILPAEEFFRFRETFPKCEFVNLSPMVLNQRKRKDPSEIEKLKKACEALHAGSRALMANLKEGTTELELSARVEHAHRLAGHEGTFFIRQPDFFMSMGPLSSGPNLFRISGVVYSISGVGLSASVPAGASRRPILTGDVVIADIPTHVEGYHADQSRTYVLGTADPRTKAMYAQLKEISDYLIDAIRPGLRCSEIYHMATKKAEQLKVADAFLNFGNRGRGRMIGHGIGLELNEPPILAGYDHSEISDGLVIALDMHMMDPDAGVVKLEDMVLITQQGNEILTRTPRDLLEV